MQMLYSRTLYWNMIPQKKNTVAYVSDAADCQTCPSPCQHGSMGVGVALGPTYGPGWSGCSRAAGTACWSHQCRRFGPVPGPGSPCRPRCGAVSEQRTSGDWIRPQQLRQGIEQGRGPKGSDQRARVGRALWPSESGRRSERALRPRFQSPLQSHVIVSSAHVSSATETLRPCFPCPIERASLRPSGLRRTSMLS